MKYYHVDHTKKPVERKVTKSSEIDEIEDGSFEIVDNRGHDICWRTKEEAIEAAIDELEEEKDELYSDITRIDDEIKVLRRAK